MATDILDIFNSFRTILCVCPCCGDVMRVSDLHIKLKEKGPRTWLDSYERKLLNVETKESKFEEKEQELKDAAKERGRKKVPQLVCNCLDTGILKMKYNPYDIKAILHPVDFVVFDGMNKGKIKDISFVSKSTMNATLNKTRASLESAISNEKYEWQVARVTIDGKISIEK